MLPQSKAFQYASMGLAGIALIGVLKVGLLVAVLAACASYAMTKALSASPILTWTGDRKQLVASLVVAALPLLALVGSGIGATHAVSEAHSEMAGLVTHLADIVAKWRETLPPFVAQHLPQDTASMEAGLVTLLKTQAGLLAGFGKTWLIGLLMAVVGLVVGLLLAHDSGPSKGLGLELRARATKFHATFLHIVVAQFWISAFNTVMTAILLYAVLPATGTTLPYSFALVLLTFVAGLLPVVGNLLCNTVLTMVALSVSPGVAAAALTFSIAIHKLEYFINAKVVGSRIATSAWELLTAMFVFEAIFGVAGLVAAPLYYAYVKSELIELGWV